MIKLFPRQNLGRSSRSLKKFFFSKKRATDLIFFLHFFLISLPVLAIPDPDVDPTLGELRARFIQEIGAQAYEDPKKFSLEVRGDILNVYGIPEDRKSLYKPHTPTRTSTLILRTPESGYLERQGLYHGYRLLFGDGYIVPSLLVQFKDTHSNTTWMLEVLPKIQSLSSLKDLKIHYETYSMGVHALGALFFSFQSITPEAFTRLNKGKNFLVQRALSSQDHLESKDPLPSNLLLSEMKSVPLPEGLKTHLKKQKVTHFIPKWLYAFFQAEERIQALGIEEKIEISEETIHSFSTLLQKMVGLTSQSSSLTYGEIETLTQRGVPSSLSSPQAPVKGIKALSLVVLNHLFFKSEQRDWTEVFEIMGETFADYGPYFKHQAHHLKDPTLVKEALHKNRKPSVLTFMLKSGLQAKDLGETLHDVVKLSGQRLDTSRATQWIKALAQAGVPLEHKSGDKTALDCAFEQHKHALIEALIENGAGAEVKPHLIIDYLSALGEKSASFNKYLDLLEFQNHRLRWQLTLEELLPLHTGQELEGSLVIRTTEGERTLSSAFILQLWNKGKIKPKQFLSFTESSNPDQTKYGRRIVGKISNGKHTLYVKQFPELPGIEEAVGIFMRQLLGYGAPNTILANINGAAYLFSEGIPGRPLHDYLTGKTEVPWSHVSDHLDPEALSGMMLLAMLTNPEDGKPDNHIVQECLDGTYRIVSIDNDHSFVPSAATFQGKRKINVKSVLFALDQMKQTLHPTLKRKFLYHNPREVLEEWIKTLQKRLEQYDSLFTPKEIIDHFKEHKSFLGIALHPSIVLELYKNLSSLQHLVESEEHLTHMDILRRFHPTIYLRYQGGHDRFPNANPLERFTYVDGKEYKVSPKKGFETLSTGAHLLSTNMMITTQKDLIDYVKRQRGHEVRLDTALATLKEIAEQDSHLLVEQALTQAGIKIPFEQMTDPQRESFLKELDWSKLSIPQQQALLDQIARVSWGDSKQNLSPWRGVLTFKNCASFTESTLLTKGFDQKMNWENIHEIRLIVDGVGGKEAYLRAAKALQSTHVSLKVELRDLTLTDEELDLMTRQGNLKKLILVNCLGMEEPILRQKVPNLVWKDWMRLAGRGILGGDVRSKAKKVILEDLGELNLGHNEIGDDGARVIAAILKDTKLHTLYFFWNKIGDDGAKALAAGLKDTKVYTLDLSHNKIGDDGVKALAAGLKDTEVHTLNLGNNNIGAAGVKALAAVLKDTQLQTLRLGGGKINIRGSKINYGGSKIGDEVVRALAAGLKDTKVHTLNLGNNNIGDEGARALAAVLKDTQLHTLHLNLNKIGDEGARALAAVLKETQVHTLYLGWNWIGDKGVQALAAVLKDTQVQTLALGGKIGDDGVRALAEVLKDTQVHTLYLSGNKIGDEGVRALAAGLKDTKVHTLNLNYNLIGVEGVQALAAVLKDTKVHTLSLRENKSGVEGVQALAAGLKDTKVHTLDLSYNKIGVEGVQALAAVLKDTKVHTLNIDHSNIGDKGAQALAAVLKDTQLQSLDLTHNNIGDEGARALAAVLKDTKVYTLKFYNNKIEDELQKQIDAILSENKAKYGSLSSEDREEEGDQKEPSETPHARSHQTSFHKEDLETLLSEAGLKGSKAQKVFTNEVERIHYLIDQNNPYTYSTILKILEGSLSLKKKELKKEKCLVLEEDSFGFEEGTSTDILPSSSDPQEKISLLEALSRVYPTALLSLARAYYQQGSTNSTLEVLTQALKHQIPGTLDQIDAFYREDNHTGYALLLAENFLQGYMSPPDLNQGETWLRQALSKDTDNPEILTKLAQVLLEKGGLEDQKSYDEISSLLSKAKKQGSIEALSLDLMIQDLQQNRKVKDDVPLSQKDQHYTAREQRLLRALHQSQFGKPHFEMQDLSDDQRKSLDVTSGKYTQERERLLTSVESEEKDLEHASPLDKPAIEAQILNLKQSLHHLQEKHHQEIKRLLFPRGISTAPCFKEFYKTLSTSIRQQFSLLDAVEGGLAARKEKFSERTLKDAAAYAVGQVGNLVISNMPVPASGILAFVVGKITEAGLNKITEVVQSKISDQSDAQAHKERQGVRDVTGNYENNTLIANGLAALCTYRLQNILPVLSQKSLKDLATRISASFLSYLQDKRRFTNPQNLTQLMVLGFYQAKEMSVGEAFERVRGRHGLKKTDGSLMGYHQIFSPLIETSDGAHYQVESRMTKKTSEEGDSFLQIVPLIEKEFLENERLQGTQTKLHERRLPQWPPFQVEILKQQDDTDYARRALEFMASL